ncbi:outer membrane protein transport protein [Pendulispora brunnea]|uniref:Outer membrane protein transport protein n=1 Tax=Pendulispora brunnea TaxID=2905690 RepID=A0ABZ2K2J5_9BACT
MSRRFGAAVGVWGPLLITVFFAGRLHAQEHDHQFFFSDDAALAGGSVAATADDSGAIYYNPAGLALNRRSHADLNASALGVRIRSIDPIMTNRLVEGTPSVKLRTVDIISTPHAAGITRRFGEHMSAGFGIYVIDYDIRTGEDTTTQTNPHSGNSLRHHVDLDLQRSKYLVGPAIGWQLVPGLRLGIGIYGTYARASSGGRIFLDESQNSQVGYLFFHSRGSLSTVGARATVGMQWDFLPSWTLAAVVRSPELQLVAWGSQLSVVSTGNSLPNEGSPPSFAVTEEEADSSITLNRPPHFLASIARKFEGGFVSAEVDVQPPLRIVSQGIDRETTFNARIGGIMPVSSTMSLGAGLFSDRAMSPLALGLSADRVDYYGLTVGGQMRTFIGMTGKTEKEPLVLTTTLAIRAAVGIGEARTYDIDASGFAPRSADVVFYELVPYLGSAIVF